jgi:hypothetical protein
MADFGGDLPWFAFCSGKYLRQPGRLFPMLGAQKYAPDAFGYSDKTTAYPDDLGLPSLASFHLSHELLRTSPTHPGMDREAIRELKPERVLRSIESVADGALGASYHVEEATNFAGWSIPVKFSYERYQYNEGQEPFRVTFAEGVVTNIASADAPQTIVSMGKQFSAQDFRFRHPTKLVDYITYTITNGIVPEVTDPELQRIYESRVAEALSGE